MDQPFKIVVTTSDKYHHILPVFCYLFNKFWGEENAVEIVGYKKPDNWDLIPKNFNFKSRGEQPNRRDQWSTTLRKYFLDQPQYFIWSMEDTFVKHFVNKKSIDILSTIIEDKTVGRVALSDYSINQYTHEYRSIDGVNILRTDELSKYNLSTQVALWNKDYLLRYLTNDLDPWQFESQRKHIDGFKNVCFDYNNTPVFHNEGVRISDIHKFNLSGFDQSILRELKEKFGV